MNSRGGESSILCVRNANKTLSSSPRLLLLPLFQRCVCARKKAEVTLKGMPARVRTFFFFFFFLKGFMRRRQGTDKAELCLREEREKMPGKTNEKERTVQMTQKIRKGQVYALARDPFPQSEKRNYETKRASGWFSLRAAMAVVAG